MSKVLAALPRIVLGAVLLLSGLAGLFQMLPAQTLAGPAAVYMAGLTGTYLFTFVKLTEIVVGVLLLSNRFVPLALVVIAPVLLNIFGFHAFYAPTSLVVPIVLVAAAGWLAWKHRAAYAPMFASRTAAAPTHSQSPGRIAAPA